MGTTLMALRLSARDKLVVGLCGLLIFGAVAYWGGVEPLKKRRAETAQSIKRLEGETFRARLLAIEAERLSRPEKKFKAKRGAELAEHILISLIESGVSGAQVVQGSTPDSVSVTVESVDYLRLMEWLEALRVKNGLTAETVNMTATGDLNIVNAEIVVLIKAM